MIPTSTPSRSVPLTERDLAVLRCLSIGSSTGEIAAALSVSSNTVRTRIRRMQAKLGAATRSELVPVARGLGLL
jgi:DNA-binding CsgD family transcriptional regulator